MMVQSLSKAELFSTSEVANPVVGGIAGGITSKPNFCGKRLQSRLPPRFFSLQAASSAVVDNDLIEEILHLERRLHRILEQPDEPAIILDALAIDPPVIKQAVIRFVKSCDTINFENLIIIVRESQLELPGWKEYRKWFREHLDEHGYGGRIACLVVQDECPECEALANWVVTSQSLLLTDPAGVGEFTVNGITAIQSDDFSLNHWLGQLQLLATSSNQTTSYNQTENIDERVFLGNCHPRFNPRP